MVSQTSSEASGYSSGAAIPKQTTSSLLPVTAGDVDGNADCEAPISCQDHNKTSEIPSAPTNKVRIEGCKGERKCQPDHSPSALKPDRLGDHKNSRQLYWLLAIAVFVLITFIGAGLGIGFAVGVFGEPGSGSAVAVTDNDTGTSTGCDGPFSEMEMLCRDNSERILVSKELPKCVQDNFDAIFVRTRPNFFNFTDFRSQSYELIFACSSQGLAMKRLSAMEYDQPTTGSLDCDYAFFTLYYELGEVEWWTEEGTALSGVCDQDGVLCADGRMVVTFENHLGEACYLTDVSHYSY